MLDQTKDVIERLRAAGLARKEFTARTERIMRGTTFVGFGDIIIRFTGKISIERMQLLAPRIAEQGFHVEQLVMNGRKSLVHVYEKGTPGLFIDEFAGEKHLPLRKVELYANA